MKKAFFVIICIASFMLFTVAFATNDKDDTVKQHTYSSRGIEFEENSSNLPSSLQKIDDEAFEGTAITNISLPDMVTTIGERAFANIATLRSIRIPMATISIAKTAFIGSNHVTINAAPNSYARTWAKENKLPFSPITVMYAGTGGQSISGSLLSASKEILETESSETQDTNKTWRRLEEIQVHDTIEIIANVVQGRAPPMA